MQTPRITRASNTSKKVEYTFKSNTYNQYVQTHMSWQDQKNLIQQSDHSIPIQVILPKNKDKTMSQIPKERNNTKILKMPIPQFEIDPMLDFDIQDDQELKISLGIQKQNSILISSQKSYSPFKIQIVSIETQTDDFTFLESIFAEPKIYQIPVQMQLCDFPQLTDKEIQVTESLLGQYQQKIQQKNSAILKNCHLEMNSGNISLSVQNYSFSKIDQQDLRRGSVISKNESIDEKPAFQDQEEMLLEMSPQYDNKQNLYRTGNFDTVFVGHEYCHSSVLQKSRFSGYYSSPDTDGLLKISRKQVNMIQGKNIATDEIGQQQLEDFRDKLYLVQQQNEQKSEQIRGLNNKILELQNNLQITDKTAKQSYIIKQSFYVCQQQLEKRVNELNQVKFNYAQLQDSYKKLKQQNQWKQQQIENIIIIKQKQIEQLLRQINSQKQQMYCVEQRLIKENQMLQSQVGQKLIEINQLKSQFDQKYQLYIVSIKEMKGKICHHQLKMEKMEILISTKDTKINQIKDENRNLKRQTQTLNKHIQTLKQQASHSSHSSSLLSDHQQSQTVTISNAHKIQEQKQNQTNLLDNNSQNIKVCSNDLTPEINDFQRGYQSSQNIITQKQKLSYNEIMNQQENNLGQMWPHREQILIQQQNKPKKFINYSFQKFGHPASSINKIRYCQGLQKYIFTYQNIIEKQIQTIEELQNKVLQFLKDALTKQTQAQLLYSQLCQYENKMNGLILQKIDKQLENKRLKKVISDSQNKLAILGNRLIKLARVNSSINSKRQPRDPHSQNDLEYLDFRINR